MAPLRYGAKLDPFLSLDCVLPPSTLAQSKERKGSNFAIWQPCSLYKEVQWKCFPLAAKRVNKPPKAVVRPAEQTIQLPTHTAIVDASDSSDDATAKDALRFKWELVVNPVGYVHTGSELDESREGNSMALQITTLVNFFAQVFISFLLARNGHQVIDSS